MSSTPSSTPPNSPRGTMPLSHSWPELPKFDLTSSTELRKHALSKRVVISDRGMEVVRKLEEMFKSVIMHHQQQFEIGDRCKLEITSIQSTMNFADLDSAKQEAIGLLANEVAMWIQGHNSLLYKAIQGIEKNDDFRASRHIRNACLQYV